MCPRFGDAGKPVFVQAFVAKFAVEAFDERVFDRLARSDEPKLHAAGIGPCIERAAAEFRSVVHDQGVRQADGLGESVQDADDAQPRQ
jgi:hypothetical protein